MKSKEYEAGKPGLDEKAGDSGSNGRFLILHNDDIHSFDYVIDTLMDVCEMDMTQAEQCAFLVHYKGQCDIKKGSLDSLKSYKERLIKKGLIATID